MSQVVSGRARRAEVGQVPNGHTLLHQNGGKESKDDERYKVLGSAQLGMCIRNLYSLAESLKQ